MVFEPKDLFEKLEFDKVRQLLEKECLGEMGATAAKAILPSTNFHEIDRQLNEVHEYKLTLERNENLPSTTYSQIDDDLKLLEIIDSVLTVEALQRINQILLFIRNIFKFFNGTRQEAFPHLYQIIRAVSFDAALIDEIEGIIDEEGNIRADASPELQKIRRTIGGKNKELEKVFRDIINRYRNQGWLTDNVESFRNGRRVLSVPAEHKRKIRGIIHDESSTGKTAFIEPDGIISINNDIFDLEQRERREIYRLLKELSNTLRPYSNLMRVYQSLLIRFDIIRAKAKLAQRMKGRMPQLKQHPVLKMIDGQHPLLLVKNALVGKKTIPFTLDLHKPNRILMLSGPNAGGKSITMKSVGLIQLMVQSGMLVPLAENSEVGIYQRIFADIGDQQSIEDDLSTYSSRLKNMKVFLEQADNSTLVLIDEFGSGTDPKIGGAIAESILKELNQKKVRGIITTHYSNLKIFAFKTKGLLNGSMLFDKDSLSPTYELKVGRPGSSYAYEIAEKSGLSKEVLDYAKHRTGKNEKAVDQLLVDLQREKQELEEQLEAQRKRESKLQHLIKTYENMHRDMEVRRKKMKLEAKEQKLQQTAADNRELERLIKELKEEKKLEKARQVAAQVREERKELAKEVHQLREKVYYAPEVDEIEQRPIEVGDFVKMKTGSATGTVESMSRNKAVVSMGNMRMTIALRDLQLAKAPLDVKRTKSVKAETYDAMADFSHRIDIRGMRFEEAIMVVENFVDKALMNGTDSLEIVHGKGSGALRKAVRQKLREYNVTMEITHPPAEAGGDGVTLVELL